MSDYDPLASGFSVSHFRADRGLSCLLARQCTYTGVWGIKSSKKVVGQLVSQRWVKGGLTDVKPVVGVDVG